jgi:putative transposase
MNSVAYSLILMARSSFRSRARMEVEILALRHQLAVLQRPKKRVSLGASDRLLWVILSRFWKQWRSALVTVKPETVIGWHRKGFRLYWRWKSRAGKCGRPRVSPETRELIRQMSTANPLWGAPRIHGRVAEAGH